MKAINGIKIFSLNEFGWWAGRDLESVKEAYQKEIGLDEDEAFDNECYELTDEQADSLKFYDDPYDKGSTRTFREQLKIMVESDMTFPCVFASTEF